MHSKVKNKMYVHIENILKHIVSNKLFSVLIHFKDNNIIFAIDHYRYNL